MEREEKRDDVDYKKRWQVIAGDTFKRQMRGRLKARKKETMVYAVLDSVLLTIKNAAPFPAETVGGKYKTSGWWASSNSSWGLC